MINKSDAYREAIFADTRKMKVQAIVDIVDPDIVKTGTVSSGADAYSDTTQIYDKEFESAEVRATLEPGRWLLDGNTPLFPDDPDELTGVKDFTSTGACGEDCTFTENVYVGLQIENCSILQTATVVFSENDLDAYPVDFDLELHTNVENALPDGYTKLDYIKSTGTQYIDTGFVPTANTRVIMDFQLTTADSSNLAVFGVAGQFSFRWYGASSVFRSNGKNTVDFPTGIDGTERHTVDKTATTCTIDSTYSVTNTAATPSLSLYLLAQHTAAGGAATLSSAKVYSCEVYDNGTLVRDFVPCVNSNNVAGLYDMVNDVFYGDSAGGEFVAGDEIATEGVIKVSIANNNRRNVSIYGFTVYNPQKIIIRPKRMSKPYSRLRVIEIIPGIYEKWGSDIIGSLDIIQQVSLSMARLPYTTCKMTVLDETRRFSPLSKDNVFLSLGNGEAIQIQIGVEIDGVTDWTTVGYYYQKTNGWSLPSVGMTVTWNMVDIVGLLSEREYVVPETMPTTVSGWLESILSLLGDSFTTKYILPEGAESIELTATAEEVEGKKCGEILRCLALATSTVCKSDTQSGGIGLFEKETASKTLVGFDNMNSYPTLAANQGVAQVIFNVKVDESTEKYAYPGTNANSDTTLSLDDLFLADEAARQAAARQIIDEYGGNKIGCRWRGDPSIEAGDVVNVQLTKDVFNSARLLKQEFNFKNGVMTNLAAELIQGAGIASYENRVIITEDSTFVIPENVTEIYVIVIGGGASGYGGWPGEYPAGVDNTTWWSGADGASGDPGEGGNVYYAALEVAAGQSFSVVIGAGGVSTEQANPYVNAEGADSSFGELSSALGTKYPRGFADISSGEVYAITGGTPEVYGSGGKGGAGGRGAYNRYESFIGGPKIVVPPTLGGLGEPGANGCVIVYYTEDT